jgi:hypothetical protein
MKKIVVVLAVGLLIAADAGAQVRVFVGPPRGMRHARVRSQRPPRRNNEPKFEPSVNLSFGYGFPNMDKYELLDFYNYYKGDFTQMGPITGALDYQFSRSMSIGVLVTHGTVSVPYYDLNYPSAIAFNGSLDNWSFMLNLMRYIPVQGNNKISPYLRTAIGINTWKQDYTDLDGNKIFVPNRLPELAYQVGLGAKFNLSKRAGIFIEGGYGKYILHSGLAFKF